MKTLLIIPFYNEEKYLKKNFESLINQTYQPQKIIYVNDNSTDNSIRILNEIVNKRNTEVSIVNNKSSNLRMPGKKVINAFNFGLKSENLNDYDLIGKFDADIELPVNYFELLLNEFKHNPKLGMASGNLYINKGNKWVYESISEKDKIRGPVKLYRVECFKAIGGLRNCIGWDSIDQLLAKYHGWDTRVVKALKVRHLRYTGQGYSMLHAKNFGETLVHLRYGMLISFLSIFKMSVYKKSMKYFFTCFYHYLKFYSSNKNHVLSVDEGKFIRTYRYKRMKQKLF